MTKRLMIIALILCVILVCAAVIILNQNDVMEVVPPAEDVYEEILPYDTQPTAEPMCLEPGNLLFIANKKHPLPDGYEPDDLTVVEVNTAGAYVRMRQEPNEAMKEMFAAAKADGANLVVASGYRSEEYQSQLYSRYVEEGGAEFADSVSSRPGYSEHQTGLAADLSYDLNDNFADTKEGLWLAEHAWEYGFILRYPRDKKGVTGFDFEPWHYRYVGREYAKLVHESGLTMEEYFHVEGGDYENLPY
ncbi:MAG: M15 family metallopeptidase [Solobacterium sp.]|nr:M15 family metallopeptidase [Solobacterium sp.]